MAEPGFWAVTDTQAANFRSYLLKGGFVIFDDFRGYDWNNLQEQMRRVLPDAHWIELDGKSAGLPLVLRDRSPGGAEGAVDLRPEPGRRPTGACSRTTIRRKRLMAIANVNNDIGEYWEFSDTGLFAGRSVERGVQVRRELRHLRDDALRRLRADSCQLTASDRARQRESCRRGRREPGVAGRHRARRPDEGGRDQIITELRKLIVGQDDIVQRGAADAVRRRQQPDHRRARPGEDAADPHPGAGARPEVHAHPVHARPDAVGHHRHRHHPGRRRRPAGARWCSRPGRSSPTSCSPTKSTARRRRRSRRCSRRCRSTASRSRGAPTSSRSRSSSSRRRTRSSSKAPIRCPKRSSIASCSTSSSSIRRRTRSSRSCGRRRRSSSRTFERPVSGADLVAFQRLVRRVPVAEPVMRYALEPGAGEPAEGADRARLDQEVGGVRRQRARGAVPGARRQGARADRAAATTSASRTSARWRTRCCAIAC